MRTHSLLLALSLALTLPMYAACGGTKQGPETVTDPSLMSPTQLFEAGVTVLKSPDKTGAIDYQAAYDLFKQAAAKDSAYAKAWFNAGWAAEQLGQPEKAVSHYQAAVDANPEYSAAVDSLARVYADLDKGAESVALYRGQVELKPDDLDARNSLLDALTAAGMYDEAEAEAKEILLRDPKNVGAYRNLSRLYFAQGKNAMSKLCSEKAKTLAEGDSGIYNNLGVTFLVMGDEPAAITEFKMARKLNPNDVEANLNLGWVALNSGDYLLARECFDAATSAQPGNVDAKLGLAIALRGAKEYDRAAEIYDQILTADPENSTAYFNAATLQEKYIKDYKKALKYLDEYIKVNAGQLSPSHEVYSRKERVEASRQKEDDRKAEEARKIKEAEERKQRQLEQLEELKAKVVTLQGYLDKYGSCEMMVEMEATDMGMMVLEQAQMVVEAGEADMAGDVMTFVDQIVPQIEEIIPMCGAGGGSGAPPADEGGDAAPAEGEGDEAPADGAGAAPAEDAPAEEAPAEEAPAEDAPAEDGGD